MLGFCPLASGSKGNAIYIGTKRTRVLIDAGISYSTLVKRLNEINVDIHTIQAVLVTHEHTDHIRGLDVLSHHLKIPVLANLETAKGIAQVFPMRPQFKIFTTGETFVFGDLEIHPFGIPHDTMEPVAFTVKTDSIKLGFCADIGHITPVVRRALTDCDYLYLEANHQPSMVHASHRPQVYKQRVLSKQGHLSNGDCALLLTQLAHPQLKHIHLAHLSSECNSPELALKIVQEALDKVGSSSELSIAFQDRISKCIYF
ncbi:MAG TPA: MBL fold metallo-hydrolase [Chlamydiales bacterium]|nr:MBL fold metallo-hydrolase [Chlamydiales bacterium]